MTTAQRDRIMGSSLRGWSVLSTTHVGSDVKLTLRHWSGEVRTLCIDYRGVAVAMEVVK